MFDKEDYLRGAAALRAPVKHLMAVAAIEASGENFWVLDNKKVPPIRPEAHWFANFTEDKYNKSHPHISSPRWNPSIAAKSRKEAWLQYREMEALDPKAAAMATSWGPFQIMGFHWKALGFPDVASFVDAMDGPDDDGQMDTFVKFVQNDPTLLDALRQGKWHTWEQRYNGGGYGGAYADKIENWLANYGSDMTSYVPRTLKRGDKGRDVGALQRALGLKPDEYFGPLTEQAVRLFQQDAGLVADGIVGKFTREALNL